MKLSLLALGLCWVAALPAEVTEPSVETEARECFDWFKSLGYPDLAHARWAKIWDGSYSGSGGSFDARPRLGFVTQAEGDEFTVLYGDLTSNKLTKSKPGVPVHEQIQFEEQDFTTHVGRVLGELRNPPKEQFPRKESLLPSFGAKLDVKAQAFVLAFACDQRGEKALANALFQEAKKIPAMTYSERTPNDKSSMKLDLERSIAHHATWRGVVLIGGGDFGNEWFGSRNNSPMKSRKELLEYFQELLRLYPHNPHLERVQKTTAMLERMVKEDEQHPTITEAELIKLPEEAQVKEWIFRLRDQNGHQWSQPGWCDIFDHMGGNNGGASPAHKLVALGYAAVPQLIEVLGDDHLTRSVGFHRDFHFSHTVLTVGDCAEQILQRISGQTFYAPASTSSYMSRDEEVSATKERVSKWWKDFQAKGERASLVEAIASGTKAPYELVQKLREKYPEAVDEAVLMGAQKATNDWVFRNYLELVGQSSAPAAMDYLRKQLKEGKNQSHRVTAARLLWNKKIPEALPAAIAEWQTALTQPAPQSSPHDGLTDLMTFLISTGNKDAMTALVRDADRLEVNRRHELITQLGEQLAQRPKPMQVFKPDPDPAVLESAEWYLVHELEDTATRNGMSGSYGDFSFVDPRLCDFALWALHRMLPERYAFSSKAGRGQRDRERIQAANIWREAHHQALLDLPEFHLAKVDAKDTLKITSVRIVPPQEKAPAVGLIQDLQSIQGQALSKSVMMQLLTSQMTDKDCRHKGLTLQFTRDDDLTGVHLVAEVGIKSRPTASGSANAQASVTLDEQRLISSTLTPTHEVNELESRWREVLTQADQALQSAPTTSFIISIHIDPQP